MRRSSPEPRRRLGALALVLGLLPPCAGCSFLENEFTWLDRAAPHAVAAPDAAADGSVARP